MHANKHYVSSYRLYFRDLNNFKISDNIKKHELYCAVKLKPVLIVRAARIHPLIAIS
jgi:hypothetical protein